MAVPWGVQVWIRQDKYFCCINISRTAMQSVLMEILMKSETRMTASVLKQDPNTRKVQRSAVYSDKTQHVNFQGNALYQATKRHLNNSWTVKNDEKWDGELSHLSVLGWAVLLWCPRPENNGHENNIAQSKTKKGLSSPSHFASSFF